MKQLKHDYLRIDLLLWQQLELLVGDDSTSQLQVAVHATSVICSENCLNSCEEAGGVPDKVSEDELKLGIVKLGEHKQGLCGTCADSPTGKRQIRISKSMGG